MRCIKLSPVLLLCLLSLTLTLGVFRAAAAAEASCPNGQCLIFLPYLGNNIEPQLLSPAKNAQITSLAPVLEWKPDIRGKHQIQISSDAAFLPSTTMAISQTKTVKDLVPTFTQLSSNLKGHTTYYWRVGVLHAGSYTYSEIRSFTTPVKNTALLPPVIAIVGPRNNESQETNKVLFKWKSVPGALRYNIRMYDANDHQVESGTEQVAGTETTYWVYNLAPHMTYHWRIKALNDYGWGDYTEYAYFRIP